MSDLKLLDLTAKLAGFKLLVRANRVGCDTHLARAAHDRLLAKLEDLIDICRTGLQAERALRLNTDPASHDYHEAALIDCLEDLDNSGRGVYPVSLLDHVIIDPDEIGYLHPVYAVWCNGPVPETAWATDEELCGLRTIIERIAEETGFRFTAYLFDRPGGDPDPDDIDPECYEDLHGFEDGSERSAVYILVNGGALRERL